MNEIRILHVDDDENDVFLFRRAMHKSGVESPIHHVAHGQGAIDYLSGEGRYADRTKYPLPHVVLLDVKMPFVDGLEVLRWIRSQKELRRTVVIMFSSSNHERDVLRATELGANSYILKPNGLDSEINLVRAFQNWWLERNEFVTPTDGDGDEMQPK